MFDYFEPRPVLFCPKCGAALGNWQGKDGPCGLFVWQQGSRYPVDQRAGDSNLARNEWTRFQLPSRFTIYTHCCHQSFAVDAMCEAGEGVWNDTRLVRAADVDAFYYYETKGQRQARKAWLESATS
jgi:hypothetical protein